MNLTKEGSRHIRSYRCVIDDDATRSQKLTSNTDIGLESINLFEWAEKGDVSQMEWGVETNPMVLRTRDENGASLLHHAAGAGNSPVIRFIHSSTDGDELNVYDEEGHVPLHWAVERNQAESCRLLLELGTDPNVLNKALMSPLHLAVSHRHNHLVELLLSHYKTDSNLKGDLGNTPIMLACSINNTDALSTLLNHGARLCIQNKLGHFAIHTAAFAGAKKAMDVILKAGEEMGHSIEEHINFLDKSSSSPLHLAVRGGNMDVIKFCVDKGAKIDQQQVDRSTALHFACTQGATEAVKLMLSTYSRVDSIINLPDGACQTPLHRSTIFDHTELAEYLIGKGADIDYIDRKGLSPLLLATNCGAWRTVSLLLSKGANMNIKDKSGRNFLHMTILQPKGLRNLPEDVLQLSSVKQLLSSEDSEGCTPLHYACRLGIHESVRNILGLHVSLEVKAKDKKSGLHFAAQYGRINTCKRLLENITDSRLVNEGDERGLTPLHLASGGGHTQVVEMLLRKGALFHSDYRGWTCLHHAAAEGFTQTMNIVLAANISLLDQKDEDGCTALHVAAREGHVAAVKLLLQRGAEIDMNKNKASFFHEALQHGRSDVINTIIDSDRFVPWSLNPMLDRTCYLGVSKYICTNILYQYCTHILYPYTAMVNYHRIELLTHPVCQKYLEMKWFQRRNYFKDLSNMQDWFSIIFSLLFVIPMFFCTPRSWHWEAGALAIIMSWINFLLYLQRFEHFGIYVVMFQEIARTLFKILLVFFFLLLAFALVFYAVMLNQVRTFRRLDLSLIQVFVMMVGELNYQSNILDMYLDNKLPFPFITFYMFLVFVIIMPILLMNMMIGLAVGDIAEVQRSAALKRMAMQIELHTNLEEKMPYWLLKRVDRPSITIHPNRRCSSVGIFFLWFLCTMCSPGTWLMKQKRLKEIYGVLEKQHNLMKLMIQKMEITSEADEHDGPIEVKGHTGISKWGRANVSKWVPLMKAIEHKKV
uniref:Ion transport domain-containing protein n=1 Tax=Esox lucius TaxID=8010 RepID=A0A6Q2YJB6_ESOLU